MYNSWEELQEVSGRKLRSGTNLISLWNSTLKTRMRYHEDTKNVSGKKNSNDTYMYERHLTKCGNMMKKIIILLRDKSFQATVFYSISSYQGPSIKNANGTHKVL